MPLVSTTYINMVLLESLVQIWAERLCELCPLVLVLPVVSLFVDGRRGLQVQTVGGADVQGGRLVGGKTGGVMGDAVGGGGGERRRGRGKDPAPSRRGRGEGEAGTPAIWKKKGVHLFCVVFGLLSRINLNGGVLVHNDITYFTLWCFGY